MRSARVVHALFVGVLILCGGSSRLSAEEPEIEFRADVEYGTGGEQKLTLDVALPKDDQSARPALVFIHGGGWAAGNKNGLQVAIREAATKGYVAVAVGYRLAPKNPFPAQVEDVKCAVRWMRAHADELKLDPTRIGAIG